MKQPGHEDATRRHAIVTAGLAAAAALVLAVLDDPAMPVAPGPAGVAAGTAAAPAGKAALLAGQAPYQRVDASARPASVPRIDRAAAVRPVAMGSTTPVLLRNK